MNGKQLVQCFKALSDETRIKIYHMLADGELCACKILEDFQISQPTLSYHMRILSDCGLVNGKRDGVWMRYTINRDNLEKLKVFLNQIE
ncbi:MAG: transcriptional regulator [Firmicutes bacterium HGW-Firmicutes-12]|nr:MAG: transcriptional regulator [Firmicutes bacterium HGW-Firmicutes-12]